MKQIQHWSHNQHPLLLSEDQNSYSEQFSCKICDQKNVAPYYVCDSCKFYVHKSCAELRHRIESHPFHPSHPLTLDTHSNYYCYSCHRYFRNAPTFRCDHQCKIYMDVECALMPPITYEGEECIQHFTHQHPMPVLIEVDDATKCFVCHSKCSSGVDYGCTKCKHFLHKLCAKLPQRIQYPDHRSHGHLTLRVAHNFFACQRCKRRDSMTLVYGCQEYCPFLLCVDCGTSVKGTIRYEDHEHILWFWDKAYDKIDYCNSYDAYCRKPALSNSTELHRTQSSIFGCLYCDFNVHLLCGPLPPIIEDKYHMHPLILVDSFVEDNLTEYCCDICESHRNPRIRVYCCEGCKFVAHVHCLISKVINILMGNLGDVELKTIGADFWKLRQDSNKNNAEKKLGVPSISTFQDLINKLPKDELLWFKEHFEWDSTSSYDENKEQQEVSQGSTTDELDLKDDYIDELLRISRFSKKGFMDFTYALSQNFYHRKMKVNSSELALRTIDVNGYTVPFYLAPVLGKLFHKHGDISSKYSKLSPGMKSIAFSFLCKVLKQLHCTIVQDITKDVLEDWYFYLEFASCRARFDINLLKDFLEAPLHKITGAFVGLQLSKLEAEVPTAINKRIDELKRQQDELKRQQQQYESKLKVCQKFHETSSKYEFVNECLTDGANLKWKTASQV